MRCELAALAREDSIASIRQKYYFPNITLKYRIEIDLSVQKSTGILHC